jgi:glucose-6-phosphate 1-dehydrogenase
MYTVVAMIAAEHPTIFIAFGASGDLMRLKVIPALFHLYRKGRLPQQFRILGFSRREWSDADFRDQIRSVIEVHAGDATEGIDAFLELFEFQRGDFDERESYERLKERCEALEDAWGMSAHKLFYLAVAPEFYTTIAGRIASAGLSERKRGHGWTRVVVEKPFGSDEASARAIDEYLAKHFAEEQIYRIDHYLAKEMLQNILTFRFSNNLFEIPWGSEIIERVDIRLLESIGAEKRGSFYDATGTLRDVGQNHLLQMLALIAMEHPRSFESEAIRAKRRDILNYLETPTDSDVKNYSKRAQYDGFRNIKGVHPESQTETYFQTRATLNHPKWMGVPFFLEAGKRLGTPLKEIVVTFRHPRPCLCPTGDHHTNAVIIRLEPKEEIVVEFWIKKPGFDFETERRDLKFLLRERGAVAQYTEEYEKLLLDCLNGDQTLFITTEEIRSMWRYIDPIVDAWSRNVVPLQTYTPDIGMRGNTLQ